MSQLIENKAGGIVADKGRDVVGVKKAYNYTIDIEQSISEREITIKIKNYPMIMNEVTIAKFGKTLNTCLQYFYRVITEGAKSE